MPTLLSSAWQIPSTPKQQHPPLQSPPTNPNRVCTCRDWFTKTRNSWFRVAKQCPQHWPRRANNVTGTQPQPLPVLTKGPAGRNAHFPHKPQKVQFHSQVLCCFDPSTPASLLSSCPVFAKPITPQVAFPQDYPTPSTLHEQQRLTWKLVTAHTTPSHLSPLTTRLQVSPVALESVSIESVHPRHTVTRVPLCASLLVLNRHFEKHVSIVYTTDHWKTRHTTQRASHVETLAYLTPSANAASVITIDRFVVHIPCDATTTNNGLVTVEFAVHCVMGGVESWDNHFGTNHCVVMKGVMVGNDAVRSARDERVALRVGMAMAREVVEIEEEFWKTGTKVESVTTEMIPV
ncbi:hypothetical protein HDU98_011489 [Podochytrium sp. JEL0797]|nr:hypothetical protein HDU98_011489 [Podochytrium sp. JEL0797]